MRRFLRRAMFIGVVWVLPVVCVGLWGGAMWQRHRVVQHSSTNWVEFVTFAHGFRIRWVQDGFTVTGFTEPKGWSHTHMRQYPDPYCTFTIPECGEGGMFEYVIVPYSLIIIIATVPMVWWYAPSKARARRRKAGLCITCGYPRRGLPDESAPCPECGCTPV